VAKKQIYQPAAFNKNLQNCGKNTICESVAKKPSTNLWQKHHLRICGKKTIYKSVAKTPSVNL
jgi:hypothetical protein